jgi:predicted amidophosphoribosyltransferase
MRCASCAFENPEGMKFCGECAAPLKRLCPQCRFENPPGFKFCGECAAPLTEQLASVQPGIVNLFSPMRVLDRVVGGLHITLLSGSQG